MATMRQLSERIKKYTSTKGMVDEALQYVNANKYIFLDIQRHQIHNQRVDRDGNPFGHYLQGRGVSVRRRNINHNIFVPTDEIQSIDSKIRTQMYGHERLASKLQGQAYNLLDTGDFSNKMTLWIRGQTIVVTSRSKHMKGMMRNKNIHSKKWFGLTEENEARFARRLGQHVARYVANGIKGG